MALVRADLPALALGVRQPWAWAIIHGGKDIENRTIDAITKGGMKLGRIAILASRGMTRDEYESAADFMRSCGVACPPAARLLRGGIIGAVTVTGIVANSDSPWFIEQRRGRGLMLADPEPCYFTPALGQLGYFKWEMIVRGRPEPAALWMRPGAKRASTPAPREPDLFS